MITDEQLQKLEPICDTNSIKEAIQTLETTKDCIKASMKLSELQHTCNALYQKQGLTPEILELQVTINTYRNKFDSIDPSEIVKSEMGENFVQ